jgi:sugar lactone lactonase YvrE
MTSPLFGELPGGTVMVRRFSPVLALLLALLSSSTVVAAGVATLVWTATFDGSDAPTQASAINLDPQGRVWVADGATNQFVIYGPDGRLLERWGTPGTGEGQFDFDNGDGPVGDVAFAPNGTFYVADLGNRRVQKFGPDRAFILTWGGAGGTADSELSAPNHVAVAPDGTVYVSDHVRGDVQHFDAAGRFLGKIGGPGSGPGQFGGAAAVAVAPDGTVYVVDLGNLRVQAFDKDGTFRFAFGRPGSGDGEFNDVFDAATDPSGNVYVSDVGNDRIQVFRPDGTYLAQWGGTGSGDGQFRTPESVAVGPGGVAFVVDLGNRRLQKFRLLPPLGQVASATPAA